MSSTANPDCPACAARGAMDAPIPAPQDVVAPCPEATTWIDIVLADDDGEPAAGAAYEIELADGTIHSGTLDADGCASVQDIEPGTARVRFPDFDIRDIEQSGAEAPPPCRCAQVTWIEIELFDSHDKPVPGAAYHVVLPDGEVCEGELDGAGKARIESLQRGACRVSFPELEQGACDLA